MLDLSKLKDLMSKVLGEMETLQEKLSDAEELGKEEDIVTAKSLYDEKATEFENLKAKTVEAKKHQERRALLTEVEELSKPADEAKGKTKTPVAPADSAEPKDHELKAKTAHEAFYKWVRQEDLSGEERNLIVPKSLAEGLKGKDAVRMPPSLVCKIMGPTYARAFGKTMYSTATPAGTATNPSAAQNLVPPEFRAELQQLPYDQPSVFDRVTVVPSSTGLVTWPALVQTAANEFGGVAFQWLGEGAEKPETEPEFEQKEIATHELSGYTEISERLLARSSINLETLLASLFRGAMVYTIDNAILQGSGTGQPLGIINTTGINLVTRAAAEAVGYADLVNLKHAVKAVHRGGATFCLEDSVETGLELLTDTQGRPLFNASVANGPYDRLTGYPYIVGTNNPALGYVGDIVYGNLRHYVLVMEEDITLARSEHVKFRENKIAFKVFTVVGGRLLQPRAMSMLSGLS